MKDFFNLLRGKLDKTKLNFHYLRVGNATPLYDQLVNYTADDQITWDHFETNDFLEFHFGPSYDNYDGALINLDIDDENVSTIRKSFWENFIWKTEHMPQLLAIVIPDTNKIGSLSKSQVSEALSLVRLTDRTFELFEIGTDHLNNISTWLTSHASIIHRKTREEEQPNEK